MVSAQGENSIPCPSSGDTVVDVRQVHKQYGKRPALRGVDLRVDRGEIVGFIGPNGSGKSSLIRVIAGLARASAGAVTVLGHELDGSFSPPGIGLVLEQQGHLPYLSGSRNLALLGSLTGHNTPGEITEVLRAVGLDPADRRPVSRWSFGMRQRLLVAQALLDQPQLLLLDEPTNGLDPAGVAELRALLGDLAASGVGVLLASHALTEVERLCRRVYFVREGQVADVVDTRKVDGHALRLQVSTAADLAKVRFWAEETGTDFVPGPDELAAVISADQPIPEIIRSVVATGADCEEITPHRPSLEQRFLELVGRAG